MPILNPPAHFGLPGVPRFNVLRSTGNAAHVSRYLGAFTETVVSFSTVTTVSTPVAFGVVNETVDVNAISVDCTRTGGTSLTLNTVGLWLNNKPFLTHTAWGTTTHTLRFGGAPLRMPQGTRLGVTYTTAGTAGPTITIGASLALRDPTSPTWIDPVGWDLGDIVSAPWVTGSGGVIMVNALKFSPTAGLGAWGAYSTASGVFGADSIVLSAAGSQTVPVSGFTATRTAWELSAGAARRVLATGMCASEGAGLEGAVMGDLLMPSVALVKAGETVAGRLWTAGTSTGSVVFAHAPLSRFYGLV